MYITCATSISPLPTRGPVLRAAKCLLRDIRATCMPGIKTGVQIELVQTVLPAEQYVLSAQKDKIVLSADDPLGFVYGLFAISREILGIQPLWFWNDQAIEKREGFPVPENWIRVSTPAAVRYRGWFINDEVLLHAWSLDGSKDKPWEMAFEALLRLGGNMVIPGTDKNAHRYEQLAADFGLYITHHHAEPLGATMFSRAYPDLTPSYDEYPELFEGLWQEAIERQKDHPVVYNLGFRGQGDKPFWADDPRFDTPKTRGALISHLIRKQYDMVQAAVPGAPCCTNLYGEVMELYRDGFIDLPEEIIRIWADNGFGKMVTRRQNNHNPRIPALPEPGSSGAHGVYYHASFYDLQAAAQMTMLPNPPSFVHKELTGAMKRRATDFWIVNCSNIKPHAYTLDYIASLWRDGDANPAQHLADYCTRYYGAENAHTVASCFCSFYANALPYGEREDERAGEQFGNHGARMLISQWMKNANEPADGMRWAMDAPTLREQVIWYRAKCEEAVNKYGKHLCDCETALPMLSNSGKILFEDSLLMQAKLLLHTYEGALMAMDSLLYAIEENWLQAFYLAGKAKEAYLAADRSMREREHGKWHLFYANDCQADVKQSAWLVSVLMGVLRNHGDGPHFYQWQRRFIDPPEDASILLLLNLENHLNNDELFALMRARME